MTGTIFATLSSIDFTVHSIMNTDINERSSLSNSLYSKLAKFFSQNTVVNPLGSPSAGMEQEKIKEDSKYVVRSLRQKEKECVFDYS